MRGKAARKENEDGGIELKLFYTLEYLTTRASLHSVISSAQRICPYVIKVWLFKKFIINNNKARYPVKICEICGLFKARHGRQKHSFFFTGQFWDFGLFVFNNMYSFRLVLKKSPKYTFRSLFYYTLSVCVCRFRLNSSKVGVLNPPAAPRSLSAPCHHIYRWKALSLLFNAVGSKYGHFLFISNESWK